MPRSRALGVPPGAQMTVKCSQYPRILLGYRFLKLIHIGTAMDIIETIKEQIAQNPVILYMKGSPDAPQCGFSQRASQAVMACGKRFAFVDVLSNPEIRANLPAYANWPTFPQLWVGGELVGGCDIITELHAKGELKPLIDSAVSE